MVELKYLAPTFDNSSAAFEYSSINQKGAIGIYFSITKPFSKE